MSAGPRLLGPADIRRLVHELNLRPTKKLGQNFVIDPNTVRRIVRASGVGADDVVLEVGPGLGSLTLGLLATVARVVAVEVDPQLAQTLPRTVAELAPSLSDRLKVIQANAVELSPLPGPALTALVANLPYNVAIPVLLHILESFPSVSRGLVMVQKEVADRLVASPGSRTYGVPSVKVAWYASVVNAGTVGRTVFWPVPNVDSGLVFLARQAQPPGDRRAVFAVVNAAFAQRRKTLRAALDGWAGSAAAAEAIVTAAGIDPRTRGEQLTINDFARIAAARAAITS
jgi:16S rRNA (adenine1518-N6/adenine1519-N6)-dimethyltransferase